MKRLIFALLTSFFVTPLMLCSAQAIEAQPGEPEACPSGVRCHLWKQMKDIEGQVLEDLNNRRDQLQPPAFDNEMHLYSGVCGMGSPDTLHYAAAVVEPYDNGPHISSVFSSLQPSEPSEIENEDPYKDYDKATVKKRIDWISADKYAVKTTTYKDTQVVFNDFTDGEYPIRYWYYQKSESPEFLQFAGFFQYMPIHCELKKRW